MNGTSLQALAAKALDEANADPAEARRILRKWLDEDPALAAAAVEHSLTWAIDNALSMALWRRQPKPSKPSEPSPLLWQGRLLTARQRFMDHVLHHSGKAFKDADRQDLLNDAHAMQTEAGRLIAFAKFEEAVAAKLKRGQVVKDVFNETKLRVLSKTI